MSQPRVLIVEDDVALREALCDTLSLSGYQALGASDGVSALQMLADENICMVISDVQMKPMDGHLLLKRIKALHPEMPVVLTTAYGTISKAVEAMRDGAADYLVKPFEAQVLLNMVSRYVRVESENSELIVVDPRSQGLAELARRVAATDVTVMITGESGTGKEVFARYIHENSPRAKGPFVAINCAAIPENMLEAVLFGYDKGAFTGAYKATPGKFEQAQDGTLLLDEISEMDLGLQAKLLRVLQEREVERLGGDKVIALNVRVLATSNRNLREVVSSGHFREDLFYRLNVFPLHLAPLRERTDDIVPLALKLIERHSQLSVLISLEAQAHLLTHHWPGNVRELDNVLQRALILKSGDMIDIASLQFEAITNLNQTIKEGAALNAVTDDSASLGNDLKDREQQLILEALQAGNGSRKFAAARLGISPRTLRYKIARMRDDGVSIPRSFLEEHA